jgi:peptide subunit release factor RF-3
MEMEQQRGISISAAALEFELEGITSPCSTRQAIRTSAKTRTARSSLSTASSWCSTAAKGVEPQTLKLFEVCRSRGLPVLTFINKLDQPARDPFELLDQIERVLGIFGGADELAARRRPDFRASTISRRTRCCCTSGRRAAAGRRPSSLPAQIARRHRACRRAAQRELIDAIEIITGAGTRFDRERTARDADTRLLRQRAERLRRRAVSARLLTLAPSPGPRLGRGLIEPTDPIFSGFIFKIQANMNPRHRDRVAFLRICSGRLAKDMAVINARLDTTLRMSARLPLLRPRSRDGSRSFPGDVVGVVNPGRIAIGDTLYAGKRCSSRRFRSFPSRQFAMLRPVDVRHKRFDEAIEQLAEEGLIQLFMPISGYASRSSASSARCSSTSSRRACRPSTASPAHSTACRMSPRAGPSQPPGVELVLPRQGDAGRRSPASRGSGVRIGLGDALLPSKRIPRSNSKKRCSGAVSLSPRAPFLHRCHFVAELVQLGRGEDLVRFLEHLSLFFFDMVLDALLQYLELGTPLLVADRGLVEFRDGCRHVVLLVALEHDVSRLGMLLQGRVEDVFLDLLVRAKVRGDPVE